MSPEIRINGKLVANVPDETGMHQTLESKPLYVNVDDIDAYAKRQRIILEAKEIGGRRELGLTHEGVGNSSNRRGDKKSPELDVKLLDRPIRVTYSRWHSDQYGNAWRDKRQTQHNPKWIRSHVQR